MMGNKKLQVWLPLIFSFILIAGMFLGYELSKPPGGKNDFFASNNRNSLQRALDLIKLKYVDSVQIDSLEGKAIQEMMNELDPHSVYLPPVDLKEANEDLAGNFEGIGVEFNLFNDTVNVAFVIHNGPSEKAGLQIGDKILKVNDSLLTGKKFTTDGIRSLIRGPRGSKAVLQILRNGKQQTISVTRATIPVPSIDAAYMIDKTTGYIKLNKFTETSYEEFMQAMEKLKKAGLQSLIFDLQGNGGGFMNEAVDMADEFLDGDKLVVYTQGVNSKKREYRCKRPGIFETGKLVVLVDELSASASEVLAGALQDWCRAKIIGRRTFGKGLVQEQFPLGDGSALRLTVARYYTPIGRSIQRSYKKGKKIYMDELLQRYANGELIFADSNKVSNGKKFITSCRDSVYGGDGIMPNVFVPIDTSFNEQDLNVRIAGSNLNNYIYNYYLQHRQQMEQYGSAADYVQHFNAAELWDGFIKYPGASMDFQKLTSKEKEMIQLRLKAVLARYKWRNEGFYQVLNNNDPVIKKALELVK
ncbi:MAG TPA: S41 family peptidase [Chitinophagaceae bacterium]|nr:S41 family peptidase [Chitinophagaceae bacterium]